MKDNFLFDFSDVTFGWDDNGFWFNCDHPLNYEAFLFFVKPIYKTYKKTISNYVNLEDNSNG